MPFISILRLEFSKYRFVSYKSKIYDIVVDYNITYVLRKSSVESMTLNFRFNIIYINAGFKTALKKGVIDFGKSRQFLSIGNRKSFILF